MSPLQIIAGGALLLLKLSLWCALPFALRPLLARGSAAIRHLVLTLTLAGTLALPLLVVTAPTWQAPSWLRLPRLASIPDDAPDRGATAGVSSRRTAARLPDRISEGDKWGTAPQGDTWWTLGPDRAGADQLTAVATPTPLAAARPPALTGPPDNPSPSWRAPNRLGLNWLAWIWLAGVAAVVLRTAAAVLHTSRAVRAATPIEDPRGAAAMARARARLRLALEPELRQSRRFPVPFAWRGFRSAVILPPSWRRWDEERLTVVLVHELAHLRRRDALALWIGRAATALWWFHPLVRMLEAWARKECEQAADDAVLLSGSRASEYAEHLLAIGRALTRPFPAGVALMMSNSPDLKHRLLAILSADRPRHTLTRRLATGTSLLALGGAVILAGVRFAPAAYAQEPVPDVGVEVPVVEVEVPVVEVEVPVVEVEVPVVEVEVPVVEVEVEVPDDWHDDHHRHSGDHRHSGHGDYNCDCDSDRDSDSDYGAGRREWKRASEAHREGRYEEAIEAFEAAAAAGFRPAVSIYNVACGMAQSGRGDEALTTLRRALELGLDRPELLAEDSDLDPLRSDARFQDLIDEAFERAGERRHPIEHHRYRSAHEALEVLRDSDSENPGAWSKVGTRLLMMRELDDAAEALERAAAAAPEAPATILYNLACAYALDGRPADALGALERSIEAGYSDPDHMLRDPDLRSLRGDSEFERLRDLADALDLDRFRRDGWWSERDEGRHGRRGRDNRYSVDRWAPAIDFYRGFVDEHPNLGAGWFNLAYALHYSERFDESVDAFQSARELGFRPATSTYNAACGYSMQNRLDEALAALEEAIELGFRSHDLDHDSDLENLRQDPRFRSLRLRMQLDREG